MMVCGVFQRYIPKEFNKMHLDGDFSFVVETDGFTSFGDDWQGPLAVMTTNGGNCELKGNHGFHPDKGPRPPFIGYGPDFLSGVVLENAELVDGAPTYAKLVGVDMPDADGKALENLLRKE